MTSSSPSSSSSIPFWAKLSAGAVALAGVSVGLFSLYSEFSQSQGKSPAPGKSQGKNKAKKKVHFQESPKTSKSSDGSFSIPAESELRQLLMGALGALKGRAAGPAEIAKLQQIVYKINPQDYSEEIIIMCAAFLEYSLESAQVSVRSPAGAAKAQQEIDKIYRRVLQLIENLNDTEGGEENTIENIRLRTAAQLRDGPTAVKSLLKLDKEISRLSFERMQMSELVSVFTNCAILGNFQRFFEWGELLKKRLNLRRLLELTQHPAYFSTAFDVVKKRKESLEESSGNKEEKIPDYPMKSLRWAVYEVLGWWEKPREILTEVAGEKEEIEKEFTGWDIYPTGAVKISRQGSFYSMESMKMRILSLIALAGPQESGEDYALNFSGSILIQLEENSPPIMIKQEYSILTIIPGTIHSAENQEYYEKLKDNEKSNQFPAGKYPTFEDSEELLTYSGTSTWETYRVKEELSSDGQPTLTPDTTPFKRIASTLEVKVRKDQKHVFRG